MKQNEEVLEIFRGDKNMNVAAEGVMSIMITSGNGNKTLTREQETRFNLHKCKYSRHGLRNSGFMTNTTK